MKKILLMTLAVVAFCTQQVDAQGIIIRGKDGSVSMFKTEDVESIVTVGKNETTVFGTWYIGYDKSSSGTQHIAGEEYLCFAGTELIWGGKSPVGYYTLKYTTLSSGTVIYATPKKGTTGSMRFKIKKQSNEQLILQYYGTERYIYCYKSKETAANVQMDPSHTETSKINTILSYGSGKSHSTKTPMGKHFENKHVTTDADREWLADPNNEPDMVANLTRWVAKTVKLYPYGDPVAADVNQHAIGDCCACAVFASFAYLYPSYIKHIIKDNGNKTYTVGMYDPQGKPVDVCVSNKILCDSNGNIGQLTGKNNAVTWATILEKALMKYMTLYKTNGVEGIGTEHVAPLFTGCGDSFAFSPNSLYTSELKLAIEHCLREGKICVGGFNKGDLLCGTLKTVTGHAFTYMFSTNENSIFAMRNPWGIEKVDGVLEIPNDRIIVQTIDARIVDPGAAAPFLREDLKPYSPPAFIAKPTDIGVSERLLNRRFDPNKDFELW